MRKFVLLCAGVKTDSVDDALPSRFEILAYTGGKLNVDGFDLPVVIDLQGLDTSTRIPIPIKHNTDDEFILGQTDEDGIVNDGMSLNLTGDVTADPEQSPSVKRVLSMAKKGHQWQASIGAEVDECYDIGDGETISVNGQELTGPLTLATRSVLRETSVLSMGADKNTRVILAQAKGEVMDFETWVTQTYGLDAASINDALRELLMSEYQEDQAESDAVDAEDATEDKVSAEDGMDKKVECEGDTTEEKKPETQAKVKSGVKSAGLVKASGSQGGKVRSISAAIVEQRRAFAAESKRVETIQARFGSDAKLVTAAIANGWDVERTELEFYRRKERKQAPAGHRREGDSQRMLNALQGAMILRAGGKLDHPAYTGELGLALDLPAWIRAGMNAESRQRAMEAAWKYRDLSMIDLCRAACEIDGKDTDGSRKGFIRAALSGSAIADIFTLSINAVLIQKLEEAGDTTLGWTQEADANNFQTMDRIRLVKGSRLTRHKRGGTADSASRNDVAESYKIQRYSQQFAVDEQDIIDDRFQALKDIPDEMALACSRMRPDLVYSILMANANLNATSTPLFSESQPVGGNSTATQANLVTGAGPLTADVLNAALARMFNMLENGVGINAPATHALVPATLFTAICGLLQSSTIVVTGTTDRTVGTDNPLKKWQEQFGIIQPVSDHRLTNGVTDPVTGTVYSGSTTTVRLVSNKVKTIEVAYLTGSGRAPQVRQYVMDRGQYGVGWDVNLDIGAKALEYRGFQEIRY